MLPCRWKLGLVLILGLLANAAPAAAQTQWNGYRNETKTPVLVQFLRADGQGAPMGPPVMLYPNEVRWEAISDNAPRMMLVRQPGMVGQLPARSMVTRPGGGDMLYVISTIVGPDGRTPVLQITKQPTKKPRS